MRGLVAGGSRLGAPALIGLCLLLLGCASSTARPDPPATFPGAAGQTASPFGFSHRAAFGTRRSRQARPLTRIGKADRRTQRRGGKRAGAEERPVDQHHLLQRPDLHGAGRASRTVRVRLTLGTAPAAALRSAWRAVPIPPGARARERQRCTAGYLAAEQRPPLGVLAPRPRPQRLAGILGRRDAQRLCRPGGLWPRGLAWSAVKLGCLSLLPIDRRGADHARRSAPRRDQSRPQHRPARNPPGRLCLTGERTDGTSQSPLSLPEGAHLRLDPTLNLAALHLPRLTRMIAEAAQRYGIFVRDRTANIAFYAQDPIALGAIPTPVRAATSKASTPPSCSPASPGATFSC